MSLLFPPAPLRIGLFALACGVIAWLSLSPAETLPTVNLWDKAEHALAYLALGLIGAWAFPNRLGWLAVGLIAFGVLIEVGQATMGLGRQGDLLDAIANSLGVAIGIGLATAYRRFTRRAAP